MIDTLVEEIPDHLLAPSEAHRELMSIRWESVITTNYDDLLERALAELEYSLEPHICTHDRDLAAGAAASGRTEILHVHGSFRRSETIVITERDYRTFDTTRPGILARVRQLFLQHPILIVGFSMTDPNFARWSAWVSDILGRDRSLALALMHRSPPSPLRVSYWGDAVRFVGITEYEKLFGILRRYLDGASDRIDDVQERLSAAKDLEGLLARLGEIVETADSEHSIAESEAAAFSWAEESARCAFNITYGAAAEHKWSLLSTAPPLTEAALGAKEPTHRQAPSVGEQLQVVRDAFGGVWYRWLALLGVGFERRERQASIHVLLVWIDISKEVSGADTLSLSPQERGAVERLRESQKAHVPGDIAAFRDGASPLEQAPTEPTELSAVELRRYGFLAYLDGETESAARWTIAAAKQSLIEGEPPLIEWLSVRTAVRLNQRHSRSKDRRQKGLESLVARREYLETLPKVTKTAKWFEDTGADPFQRHQVPESVN